MDLFLPALLTCAAIVILRRLTWHRRLILPGPPGLPVIGNLHQFPPSHQYRKWHEWGKEYGPLIQVKALSQPMVIINSPRVATDLLIERGRVYAGRPFFPMASGEIGWKRIFVWMDPGETLRESRGMMHRILEGKKVDRFRGHVETEIQKLISRLHKSPTDFLSHIQTAAGSIILLISHGYVVDPRPNKDPFVKIVVQAMAEGTLAFTPGEWLVDAVPFLKYIPSWFPGAGFKRIAKAQRQTLNKFAAEPHEWVKNEMQSGSVLPSCTSTLLEEIEGHGDLKREDTIKWAMASLVGGGTDTSISALTTFFFAISRSPEVVARAHEELDRVVGPDRLPSLEDRAALPYIEAIMSESLRFGPPAPAGLPHKVLEDDIYEGYLIKKGSMVFANIWGMLHDEEIFNNPQEFIPERFLERQLGKDWKYVPHKRDPRVMTFGYGRRVCPGKDLALLFLWHAIATTLHVFDISSGGENGSAPLAEHPLVDSMLFHLAPFTCTIKPRSDKAEALIKNID